ncbi:glycosyltransferase [Winogradskyella flava]|uniref:glycosyltransferase n=1 Tax=Winogradskyella flava TaxID=1884876 RepID=UPI00249283A0|nr:glycosyltransferase [Winogradskyella flava]
MKILIVGSKKEWAFENYYLKHLKPICDEVEIFDGHDMFYDYYYKSIINKVIFRSGFSNIYKKINQKLLDLLEQDKYDIIWVFKGMEIYPETLVKIKVMGLKLVNFNPDHPFVYNYRGSGNKNVLNSIKHYHLHLCYNLNVKSKIEKEIGARCEWLPFGFEHRETNHVLTEIEEIKRACFIGNPDEFRAKYLIMLSARGIPIDVYGNNWDTWIEKKDGVHITCFDPIYKEDFDKTAVKYRLQLNIFRPHNDNSHNMRTFEMPGLGCIMLAPDSKEHQIFFKINEEAFFYSDIEDMALQAKMILDMPFSNARKVRENAVNRSLKSGYSYKSRAKLVYNYFENI